MLSTALLSLLLIAGQGSTFTLTGGETCPSSTPCTLLSKCPPLLSLLTKVKGGDEAALEELVASQCGFSGLLPRVCCPTQGTMAQGNTRNPRKKPNTNSSAGKGRGRGKAVPNRSSGRGRNQPTEGRGRGAPSSSIDQSKFPSGRGRETSSSSSGRRVTTLPSNALPTASPGGGRSPSSGEGRTISKARPSRISGTSSLQPNQPDWSNLNHPKCGIRSALNFRVTFGVSSSPGQFPWVAALLYRRGSLSLPLCAAALISRTLLLTAAHCTTNLGGFTLHRARLGQIDVTGAVKSPGVEVGISQVMIHPNYEQDPLATSDIAVLRLRSSLRFSDYVRPICLSLEGRREGLQVAGWGKTEERERSPTLQHTTLVEVGREECSAEYSGAGAPPLLASQLCARGAGGSDSCTGDSGAPLMARVAARWTVEGIVSYGTQSCDSSLPGVYTRVASFLPWLHSIINST